MAPKPKAKAKGPEDDAEVLHTFFTQLKRNMREYDVQEIPEFTEVIKKKLEDGSEEGDQYCWRFTREFDLLSFRVLFHSLKTSGFQLLEAIRVWKCNGGDESVRSICHYLDADPESSDKKDSDKKWEPHCKELQFTDNGVTELGCEFLGRTLGPNGNKGVNVLILNYNQFGTPGMEKLSQGLSQNATLRRLHLAYCGIDEEGGQYIGHVLMFINCALEDLDLKGNYLRDQGVLEVLRGARRAKSLEMINLFDNKFTDTPDIIKALQDLFEQNEKLISYNLAGNPISDTGARELVKGMIGKRHLSDVKISERCSQKTFAALEELGAGKKKGGKKKK